MDLCSVPAEGEAAGSVDWAAVIAKADGQRWVGFELGNHNGNTFIRLLSRLPETVEYRSDHYSAYGLLPQRRHTAGKSDAVNWNEGLTPDGGTR